MYKQLAYYWQEMNKRYSSNQVFLILCYWILTVYQQTVEKMEFPDTIMGWRVALLESLRKSMDYDIKESAVRLSDRIEWDVLEADDAVAVLLMDYAIEVRNFIGNCHYENQMIQTPVTVKNLQFLIRSLFCIAEINGLYSSTPDSIVSVVMSVIAGSKAKSMLDLCCGSGSMGIAVWQQLGESEGTIYYGVDIEPIMCDVCTIMTYLCGISQGETVLQDVLRSSTDDMRQKHDLVLLDVPRGQNKYTQIQEYGNWLEGIGQKNIYVDWLYVMRAVSVLSSRGKAVAVVTSGTLTRKNEEDIRKRLILNDWIEAVITLPANLYPNARTGSEIIIFNKSKDRKREKKILFIDISKYFFRDNRNFYAITQEGHDYVADVYSKYCEVENVSRIVNVSEMEKAGWSLKPLRYLEGYDEMEEGGLTFYLKDIARIARGVQLKKEEEDILCGKGDAFYINIRDIQEGEIDYKNAKNILPKNKEWHDKFQIQEDDILITSKGTTLKIAIVGENPPEAYICGNITLIRTTSEKYHPYVLYEFLTSAEGISALESIQSGTTIRVLNNTNMEQLRIPAYSRDLMFRVGKQLKQKKLQYTAKRRELEEGYLLERSVLLELL